MKHFAFTGALLVAVALTACGAGEESSAGEKPRSRMSAAEMAKLPLFKIRARQGPEPRRLVVHDLRKGSGAVMKRGDTMFVDWTEIRYGEALETTSDTPKKTLKFTFEKVIEGWEEGLPGMKVGGRRELIVPPRLGDTGLTMIYMVDLLAVEPPPE